MVGVREDKNVVRKKEEDKSKNRVKHFLEEDILVAATNRNNFESGNGTSWLL